MKLPNNQDAIIRELLAVRPDMIVTMLAGSPVDMHEWVDDVKTLLYYSYNGMQGGRAFANVVFGNVNPSGKLTMTLPRVLEDSPAHKLGEFPGNDAVHYNEDIYVGYRYFDTYDVKPAFAFGHGITYTDFNFGSLTISGSLEENGCFDASLPITNIGDKAGSAVALFFVKPLDSSIDRPLKELRGFEKKYLEAGATATFSAKLDAYSFSYYDEDRKCYVALPGTYEICAAYACDDIRSIATVTLDKEYTIAR